MNFLRITIVILSVITAACASHHPKSPATQELFTTTIKRDGAKQFSYAMIMDVPSDDKRTRNGKRGGPGRGYGDHPGGPPRGDHDHSTDGEKPAENGGRDKGEHFNVMFNEGLIAKISDSGFCRQGYKQLDKKSRLGAIQITGECNDMANDEDRVKFPNQPPVKVKEETIE